MKAAYIPPWLARRLACLLVVMALVLWAATRSYISWWVATILCALISVVTASYRIQERKLQREAKNYRIKRRDDKRIAWEARLAADPEFAKRIEAAVRLQPQPDAKFPTYHDPIEDDEATAQIFKQVRERIRAEFDQPYEHGDCHRIWARMKAILKDEHGIAWYSIGEMNPDSHYD